MIPSLPSSLWLVSIICGALSTIATAQAPSEGPQLPGKDLSKVKEALKLDPEAVKTIREAVKEKSLKPAVEKGDQLKKPTDDQPSEGLDLPKNMPRKDSVQQVPKGAQPSPKINHSGLTDQVPFQIPGGGNPGRSQAPGEKAMWDAIRALQDEVAALKQRQASQEQRVQNLNTVGKDHEERITQLEKAQTTPKP